MKKIAILSLLVFLAGIPAISPADITQSDRLMQRPEWDGAVMPSSYVDGAVTYEKWSRDSVDADLWMMGTTFITSLPSLRNLELGGRLDFMNYDTDNMDSESGLSDIDFWGKFQFFKDTQYMLSAGLLMTLPTGSNDIYHPHASGEINAEMFVAGRYQADRLLAVIAHLALRQNNDMDVKIGRYTYSRDGETQLALGGGLIYQVAPQVNLQGELNFATEPYDDFDNDIQLRGGVDYKLRSDLSLKGGLSIGLNDGAPDWALTFRCAYLF